MILEMYCVKDRATDVFGTPMFLLASGQAIRSFGDEVNRSAVDNQLFQHPDDFDLFRLGTWDNVTGMFLPCAPELVVRGKELVVKNMELN